MKLFLNPLQVVLLTVATQEHIKYNPLNKTSRVLTPTSKFRVSLLVHSSLPNDVRRSVANGRAKRR